MNIPTLDKCPGYNLYIGGFIALRRPQALKNCNITHIVSVLDWKFEDDTPLTKGYRHLHIPVDDVEDENLLDWFPRSNVFIQEGLDYWKKSQAGAATVAKGVTENEKGSGVLIHCAMGKSRSATILLAYLLWSSRQPQPSSDSDSEMVSLPTKPLSVVKALEILRGGRPIAEPNEGFMDQLHKYEAMGCPSTEQEIKRHKIYRRWMNKRSLEESLRVNQAPEMESIKFEDENDEDEDEDTTNSKEVRGKNMKPIAPGVLAPDGTLPTSAPAMDTSSTAEPTQQITLKCRKCRHTLATTPFIQPHVPPPHRDPSSHNHEPISSTSPQPAPQCAHIFLHPLSWMRPVLSEGQMEGRLTCPNSKCGTNVGKFAWTGLRCSCGGWVTPGFGIIRGKVDEVVSRGVGAAAAAGHGKHHAKDGIGAANAVRLPPGMKRGNL